MIFSSGRLLSDICLYLFRVLKGRKEGRKENERRKEGRSKAIAKEKGEEERRGEERSAAQRSTTEKRQKNPSGNFEMVKKKDNPPPLPRWDDRVHDP